jgi:hypothetical protein
MRCEKCIGSKVGIENGDSQVCHGGALSSGKPGKKAWGLKPIEGSPYLCKFGNAF